MKFLKESIVKISEIEIEKKKCKKGFKQKKKANTLMSR
jgi:hypothetical protein